MAIEKMNQGYIQSKEKYNGVIQQRENDIKEMANETIKMVNDSVDSFVKKDLEMANRVINDDDKVDELFTVVKQDLMILLKKL